MNNGERAKGERTKEDTGGAVSIGRQWAEYLVAILLGNIIYLFIEPQLPTAIRHRMFRVDFGLAIDFFICVALYAVVRLFRGIGDDGE
jgi:hypothetical protein